MDSQRKGGAYGYIDDGGTVLLDSPNNWIMVSRACQSVVMSIFIIFRTIAGELEPIKQPDPASISKNDR